MVSERSLQKIIFQSNPHEQTCSKEFINGVIMFGSFLSVLNNKRINPSTLFTSILQNYEMRELFVLLTGSQTTYTALLGLLHLYPNLVKSKNTKKLFNSSIKKKNDRIRKKDL